MYSAEEMNNEEVNEPTNVLAWDRWPSHGTSLSPFTDHPSVCPGGRAPPSDGVSLVFVQIMEMSGVRITTPAKTSSVRDRIMLGVIFVTAGYPANPMTMVMWCGPLYIALQPTG